MTTRELREACREATEISEWLFEESYEAVGDLAEVVAILLPDPRDVSSRPLQEWIEQRLIPLRQMSEGSDGRFSGSRGTSWIALNVLSGTSC